MLRHAYLFSRYFDAIDASAMLLFDLHAAVDGRHAFDAMMPHFQPILPPYARCAIYCRLMRHYALTLLRHTSQLLRHYALRHTLMILLRCHAC